MTFQKIIIIGNLGRDPELRHTPGGKPVTNFSVATNRRWTGTDGQPQEETTWFRVSAWGKLAEICSQYLSKGRQVFIEGRLTVDRASGGPRVWIDQDGTPRASFEVTALDMKFLGQKSSSSTTHGFEPEADLDGDEIPF